MTDKKTQIKKSLSGLIITPLRQVFWERKLNLYLFIATLFFDSLAIAMWKLRFAEFEQNLFQPTSLSFITYVNIVITINLIIAMASADSEKNIATLILSISLFLTLLVLLMEIVYLSNPLI